MCSSLGVRKLNSFQMKLDQKLWYNSMMMDYLFIEPAENCCQVNYKMHVEWTSSFPHQLFVLQICSTVLYFLLMRT